MLLRQDGTTFSVIAERDVAPTDNGFAAWLTPFKPSKVLAVLPASTTVCRTCALPPTQGEQLASALRLQAETALLGGLAGHRVGMAALTLSNAGAGSAFAARQGVIISWPESAAVAKVPELPPLCELRYVPSVAALLGLLGGEIPATPLIRANRDDGTIIFVLSSPSGMLLRSTREDTTDLAQWREGVLRASAETLLAADRSAEEIRALQAEITAQLDQSTNGSFVLMPASAASAFSRGLPGGRSGDAAKDADRTIALGAALVATGPLAGLAAMRGSVPTPPPHPIERASRWLAVPRNMLAVLFVGMLVFLLGPLLGSSIRYGVLRWKLPDAEKVEALNRETQQSVMVYRQLGKEAWPMGKLLGDLSNALPEGVEIEMLQIAHGDGITLRGVGKPFTSKGPDGKVVEEFAAADELWRMETMLRSTKIFVNAQYKWDERDAKGYVGFSLTCDVAQPTRVVSWDKKHDFAVVTQRDRKYPNWREIEKGSTASASDESEAAASATDGGTRTARVADEGETPTPNDSTRVAADTTGASSETNNGTRVVDLAAENGEADPNKVVETDSASGPQIGIRRPKPPVDPDKPADGAAGTDGPRPLTQPATAPAVDIPGPFTDEEIKALSKGEAQSLLGKISRARQLPTLDEETKKRLRDDFQRVLAQAKAAT